MFELDHVLVFAAKDAPEAAALEAAGLKIGRRKRHTGQGTANACFLFQNAMLELLWIENVAEVRLPAVAPLELDLRARWRQLDNCPIGIAVRARSDPAEPPPFACWDYVPPFGTPDRPLRVAQNAAGAKEPLLFSVPAPYFPPEQHLPLHDRTVTAVRVQVAKLKPDSPLRGLPFVGIEFRDGPEHHVEIELDAGKDGRSVDLMPQLPVLLRW